MIDGTYKADVDTPFGRKPGTVALRQEGDAAIAEIDAPLIGKQQIEGRVEGDTFTAEGVFKLRLLGKVDYSLTGKVVGDELHISITSSKGNLEVTGVRV